MSVKLMTLAYKMTPLNLVEKSVLTALAFTADKDGFCFPGYKDLMEKTGIGSKSTLSKTLAILEGAGLFIRESHAKFGSGRKVNTYQLVFDDSWFQFVSQPGSESPQAVLIESTRRGLIEKINELRKGKKRTISTHLEPAKVHTSNPISTPRVHESSFKLHSESSYKHIGDKSVEGVIKKPPKKTKTSATRLPANWEPLDQDIAFCVSNRPDLNVNDVADEFRDYWIAVPGAKGKKEDWPATWRNWVRKQFVKQGGSVAKQQPPKQSRMSLTGIDYSEGVNPDGSF